MFSEFHIKEVKAFMMNQHHIVYNPNGGWDVKKNNAKKASAHCNTKKEAVDKGRVISKNNKTELIVHNKNGKISHSDSHGNDPCPPKDRR